MKAIAFVGPLIALSAGFCGRLCPPRPDRYCRNSTFNPPEVYRGANRSKGKT